MMKRNKHRRFNFEPKGAFKEEGDIQSVILRFSKLSKKATRIKANCLELDEYLINVDFGVVNISFERKFTQSKVINFLIVTSPENKVFKFSSKVDFDEYIKTSLLTSVCNIATFPSINSNPTAFEREFEFNLVPSLESNISFFEEKYLGL